MPEIDLFAQTEQRASLAPQSVATGATVSGSGIDRVNREKVVVELSIAAPSGAPTGGNITLIPLEGDATSTLAQVGTDSVVIASTATFPTVARYRYTGTRRFVGVRAVNNLTGGTTPAAIVAGSVLTGSARFVGKQPGIDKQITN